MVLPAEIANASHTSQVTCLFSELNMPHIHNLSVPRKMSLLRPVCQAKLKCRYICLCNISNKIQRETLISCRGRESTPANKHSELPRVGVSRSIQPQASASREVAPEVFKRCLCKCVEWREVLGAPGTPTLVTKAAFWQECESLLWFRGSKGKTSFLLHRQVWKCKSKQKCKAIVRLKRSSSLAPLWLQWPDSVKQMGALPLCDFSRSISESEIHAEVFCWIRTHKPVASDEYTYAVIFTVIADVWASSKKENPLGLIGTPEFQFDWWPMGCSELEG